MWRTLFGAALDPEIYLDADHVRDLMATATGHVRSDDLRRPGPPTQGPSTQDPQAWSSRRSDAHRGLLPDTDTASPPDPVARALLTCSAPFAAVLGCWLQGLSAPGVFEDAGHLRLLTLFADDVGAGQPGASRADAYRHLLSELALPRYAVGAADLVAVREVPDEMFALPAVLLAMSRRSDTFAFPLVGVDHVLRERGTLPVWRALRARGPASVAWDRLDLSVASGRTSVTDPPAESAAVVRACRTAGGGAGVAAGAEWAAAAVDAWDDALLAAGARAADPAAAVHDLLRARAREAAVYHGSTVLEGHRLADLFAEARTDPRRLVEVLGRSALVRPGAPERSPLLNGLIAPSGPMFRVFGRGDIEVIRRWITHLGSARPDGGRPEAAVRRTAPRPDPPAAPAPAPGPGWTLREAYHRLQGRALTPQARTYAVDAVDRRLEAARRSLGSSHSLPAAWTAAGLRPWLADRHDHHDRELAATAGSEVPDRADVIDAAVQLAPLTLIDGSWLQGFTDACLAASPVGAPLFETYWDELGNGEPQLNHPLIYREVLRSMGVELPPSGSVELAFEPRIREESLRLPVYWLSIGKLPVTYRPEILGLNLAMELSGVGGSYRSAHRFLRHHGFDTRFVDIHNTIDNVADGHSAWAADAVDTHMRDLVSRSGPDDAAREWLRVRLGYESLAPARPATPTVRTVLRSARARLRVDLRVDLRPDLRPRGRRRQSPALHHAPIGALS